MGWGNSIFNAVELLSIISLDIEGSEFRDQLELCGFTFFSLYLIQEGWNPKKYCIPRISLPKGSVGFLLRRVPTSFQQLPKSL